jgi:hypothetical protein
MNTLDELKVTHVSSTADTLRVDFDDGRSVSLPLIWFPRLFRATQAQRDNYELMGKGFGVHWPDVDEDLSRNDAVATDAGRDGSPHYGALPALSFFAGRSPNGAQQSSAAKCIPSPWGEGRVRGTATFESLHGLTETSSTASLRLSPQRSQVTNPKIHQSINPFRPCSPPSPP